MVTCTLSLVRKFSISGSGDKSMKRSVTGILPYMNFSIDSYSSGRIVEA